jgi:hypothetical protein
MTDHPTTALAIVMDQATRGMPATKIARRAALQPASAEPSVS